MDFGALPPEINSTRMYAGAGAAPLMAAGATWNGLAVELSTTASSVESVIMQLTTEQWLGPASMSMVVAAQPYLAWLTYTAESAAHAAAQAMASAAAFEAAFAMTVPPAEVAANRALLAALVATNVLGQNTPAIMATEAHYGEMWAQDALAMYGYAASSAAAGRLNPLITPSQTANMAGLAGQAAAVSHAAAASTVQQVGLGSLISNLPNAVMGFASPLTSAADAAGLGGIIQDIEELLGITFVQNAINGAVNTTAWFVMATIPNAVFLGHAFAALNPATVTAAGVVGGERRVVLRAADVDGGADPVGQQVRAVRAVGHQTAGVESCRGGDTIRQAAGHHHRHSPAHAVAADTEAVPDHLRAAGQVVEKRIGITGYPVGR